MKVKLLNGISQNMSYIIVKALLNKHHLKDLNLLKIFCIQVKSSKGHCGIPPHGQIQWSLHAFSKQILLKSYSELSLFALSQPRGRDFLSTTMEFMTLSI